MPLWISPLGRSLLSLLAGALTLSPVSYAEPRRTRPATEPAAGPARPEIAPRRLPKPGKQSDNQLKKELESPYKKWLDEDVIYIITPEERHSFLHLATNEEREQFIEAFWQRRNPDPDSPENTFKEEHYRRIAYANEHFASGIPGWKTDRGRIYIMWGPPDEIDSHPTGGTYDRPIEPGRRRQRHLPWESWRYRHLDGPGWARTSSSSSWIRPRPANIT